MLPVAHTESSRIPADLLSNIAHELRQPLGTIQSIAYYLSLILPRGDDRAQEQVAKLQQLVEQSNWILTSGLQLAEDSPVSAAMIDLGELITEVISARGPLNRPPLRLDLQPSVAPVHLEYSRGRMLIENLLMLFSQIAEDGVPMMLKLSTSNDGNAVLEMDARTPGVVSESNLGCGCDLSIESARRIVDAHGGTFEFTVDPGIGIRLRVMLP